jgi:hypothetical protein
MAPMRTAPGTTTSISPALSNAVPTNGAWWAS